jgi:hypothetical protein
VAYLSEFWLLEESDDRKMQQFKRQTVGLRNEIDEILRERFIARRGFKLLQPNLELREISGILALCRTRRTPADDTAVNPTQLVQQRDPFNVGT